MVYHDELHLRTLIAFDAYVAAALAQCTGTTGAWYSAIFGAVPSARSEDGQFAIDFRLGRRQSRSHAAQHEMDRIDLLRVHVVARDDQISRLSAPPQ